MEQPLGFPISKSVPFHLLLLLLRGLQVQPRPSSSSANC
ncbi:hypothetical protein PVAP13_1KG159700 [Panicum virgatum]|uniref:Uncharacterized protein n=1 Tax=Panicum virgatum TaxID=38727 RepID=A0A8T0XDU1_PANVG|nr:hypothetical protein PVAP13_1KG159700 [Panicum virgatum]